MKPSWLDSAGKIPDLDLAYLAGLFDGEGCLGLSLNGKRRRRDGTRTITIGVIFNVVNTCKEVLDWCLNTIGYGYVVEAKSTVKSPRRLSTFRYNLDQKGVLVQLLPMLRPYLKVKCAQTDAVLRFLRSRKGKPWGSPFTEEEVDLAFQARLANQKSYNKGSTEHVTYKGQHYTKDEFRDLLLAGRDGSIYRMIQWTPDMDALLGTDIDRVVAHQLGLKIAQVQKRRDSLGIAPCHSIRDKVPQIIALRSQGFVMTKIAVEVGVSFSSVERVLSNLAALPEEP